MYLRFVSTAHTRWNVMCCPTYSCTEYLVPPCLHFMFNPKTFSSSEMTWASSSALAVRGLRRMAVMLCSVVKSSRQLLQEIKHQKCWHLLTAQPSMPQHKQLCHDHFWSLIYNNSNCWGLIYDKSNKVHCDVLQLPSSFEWSTASK